MEIQYPEEFGIDSDGKPKLRIQCKCGSFAYTHSRRRKSGMEIHYYSCIGCCSRVTFDPEDGIPRGTLADTETRKLRLLLTQTVARLKTKGKLEEFRAKTNKRFIMIGYLGKKELVKISAIAEKVEKGS